VVARGLLRGSLTASTLETTMRARHWAVVTALFVTLMLSGRPARAAGDSYWPYDFLAFGFPGLTIAAYGTATAIGNGFSLRDGQRPSLAWTVHGYVASTLNIAGGAALIGIGQLPGGPDGPAIRYGVGATNLAVGITSLAFTIVAHRLPRREATLPARLSIGPLRGILGSERTLGAHGGVTASLPLP
jgi:hypothetical protein